MFFSRRFFVDLNLQPLLLQQGGAEPAGIGCGQSSLVGGQQLASLVDGQHLTTELQKCHLAVLLYRISEPGVGPCRGGLDGEVASLLFAGIDGLLRGLDRPYL